MVCAQEAAERREAMKGWEQLRGAHAPHAGTCSPGRATPRDLSCAASVLWVPRGGGVGVRAHMPSRWLQAFKKGPSHPCLSAPHGMGVGPGTVLSRQPARLGPRLPSLGRMVSASLSSSTLHTSANFFRLRKLDVSRLPAGGSGVITSEALVPAA